MKVFPSLNIYINFLENNWKINQYVYKMIETLLPKANYENDSPLKMMEL